MLLLEVERGVCIGMYMNGRRNMSLVVYVFYVLDRCRF